MTRFRRCSAMRWRPQGAGVSSRKRHPGLSSLRLDWMREGDTLVVWRRLDRLARLIRQLIGTVEDLDAQDIGVRSLTETIGTTAPGDRPVFCIFDALAEFERSLISGGPGPASTLPGPAVISSASHRRSTKVALRRRVHSCGIPQIPTIEVVRRVGGSKATLYKRFPGGPFETLEERPPRARRP